jgi:hyaluronate lyase
VLRLSQFAPAADALNYRRMAKEWILSDAALNFYVDAPISYALLAKAVVGDPGIARRAAPSQAVVFAGMDRSVQQRPGYAFAVSMHSDRIYNFESINNENLRGWHQGDGATFLHNGDQTQFSDGFWPTVNPSRLPGITAEQGTAEPANTLSNQKWVGGSALNGYSATGMALHTPGQSLSAYKSWFAFDNEIVALGTGINATDGKDVQTIVENRKSPGTLTVNGASKTSGIWGGVRWAQLSGVGYYFPGGRTVTGLRETRYGRWSDINTQVPFGNTTLLSRYYQSLAIDHGVNPRNGSYSYALLPDRTASQTGAYAATPQFSILRNDATAQAVKENTIGVTAANIYSDGGVSAGWIWSARKASIVLQVRNGRIDVSVSDPTRLSGTFEVRIARSASTVIAKDPAVKVLGTGSSIRLSINTTGLAGRSVHASFR